MDMELLAPARDQVGESPLWSPAESCLWWVDIEGRFLRRLDWSSGRTTDWATPERTGCIALFEGGGLLAAMETGLFRLTPHGDGRLEVEPLAGVQHAREGMRFNDGRCDRAGRFFAGTMLRDMAQGAACGAVYRFDAAGLSAPLVSSMVVPNGMAFSADNKTMYLSDSHPTVQRIWAFDLGDDGVPRYRREFVDMNAHPGRPDGAAIDVDGGYWICGNDAGLVHRFTPDGRLDRSLKVPVDKPSMCAFAGPRLDHLVVASIRPGQVPAGQEALAGALFVARPGTQGLAETPFQPRRPA